MAHWRTVVGAGALALAAACLGVARAEPPKSGPPVGGSTAPFTVQDVTGPAKGSNLCYI